MESQKIKNLLDHKDETYPKYQTKRWYNINDRNNGQNDEDNDTPIKIDTKVVKPFLCDYADAYILVTGDSTVKNIATADFPDTKSAFKNCHPFVKSEIHLNDEHVEDSDNLDIIMNMYNCYIRQEQNYAANGNINNITFNDSSSFKYKSKLLKSPTAEDGNVVWKNAQIIVPLKYISPFLDH